MKLLDAIIPTRSAVPVRGNDMSAYFGDQLGGFTTISVGGQTYQLPIMTTIPGQKTEAIANNFEAFCLNGLMGNSVVFALAALRMRVFSEARFMYQRMNKGRPADLWSDKSLALLDHPWPGGVTGDLLAIMILHNDFAGNAYVAHLNGQLAALRPDWVEIILAERLWTDNGGHRGAVGMEKVGYLYYQGGKGTGVKPMIFGREDICHFCPQQDPLAWYRGMSWLTPVIREIRGDNAAMDHKLAFFSNAATSNLAVSLQGITDPDQFNRFVDAMDEAHKGTANAYKTMYLGAGADVTVIGSSLKDMDFSTVQGKGETRLASAAGIPPTVAGLSEGLQGSSLNAGNFGQARRMLADLTMSPLWRSAAGSLETIIKPPDSGSRLWYDTRDIPFLREDQKDLAAIQASKSQAIRELFMAGFESDSIVAAVMADDFSLLKAQAVYSIQVQTPGMMQPKMPSNVNEPPAGPESTGTDVQKAVATTSGTPALPPAKTPVRSDDEDYYHQQMLIERLVAVLSHPPMQPDINVTMPAVTINLTVEPAGVTVQPPEVTVEPAEITVNVEATQVTVEATQVTVEPTEVNVNVPAAQVTVEPAEITVNVEAPQVRVEPPQVNVEAPNVYVDAPPPAEVTVNVDAPPPRSRSVERNANGDITRIVEEDQ